MRFAYLSVGIVTGYGLEGPGSVPGSTIFSLLHSIQTISGASYSMGTGGFSPEVKWQGHEADHSPPTSAEVKKGGAIPPLPHMSSCYFA
jgi:hypothetical protein